MKIHLANGRQADETWFDEGCWIQEWSNDAGDPDCSVARARVPARAMTRWHRLHGIAERYVILDGTGTVEVESEDDALRRPVGPGDVVRIPAGARQRVRADGEELVFLAICTPRFRPEAYEDVDPDIDPGTDREP